jgi:ubiquinone/menaquinone biosynthesis C-methylase UbiE
MTIAEQARATWAQIAAHVYDPFLALAERRSMAAHRQSLLAHAAGRVLELGAGTGLNLPHYPPHIRELVLTEPEPAMRARLERRVLRAARPAAVVAASADALPFEDGSFDTVVSTMVLCTVPDPAAAVTEVRRVLAPGGRLLFVEHVRAVSGRLARWQDRLAGPWAAFAQGCRCDRATDELLARELRIEGLSRARWSGMPALVHPLIVGHAGAAEQA